MTRRGVSVVFSPSVRSVLVVRVIPVCLLLHDTRICCIKDQRGCSQLRLPDLFLSSSCRAQHI